MSRVGPDVYFARVTERRLGYSVRVCVRPCGLAPDAPDSFVGGIDPDWLVMEEAAARWRPTRRGAERLGWRLVDRRNAFATREAASTTVEGTT